MAWIWLCAAGIFEVVWAIGLKLSGGLSLVRWPATLGTLAAMAASVLLLAEAQKSLPIGTAYGVWTGIGACGTAFLGILLFGEPAGLLRLLCLAFIILGILGLRYLGA